MSPSTYQISDFQYLNDVMDDSEYLPEYKGIEGREMMFHSFMCVLIASTNTTEAFLISNSESSLDSDRDKSTHMQKLMH
jgi:hypothetical protein